MIVSTKNNRGGFGLIPDIIIIAVIVLAAVGYFIPVRKYELNTHQQIPNTIDANWKVYQNERYHFTLRIPENLVAITENNTPDLSDFLFVDQNDFKKIENDPLFKTNPLLITLGYNISGLHFFINASSWVLNSRESDIKSYLSAPASGPHGDVKVVLKDFTPLTGNDGIRIYLYTRELKATPVIQDTGALWISRGVMYTLTSLSGKNSPPKEVLRAIAKSFIKNN